MTTTQNTSHGTVTDYATGEPIRPATAVELARTEAKLTSGDCYWRRIHAGQSKDSAGRSYHDHATYSVIINGLVRVTGKTPSGRYTYEVTDAGAAFAQA